MLKLLLVNNINFNFIFMPYYIDQDSGWGGLYDSFKSIDQYKKPDRIKSLYYHLNIYTKGTVGLMAKRDQLKERFEFLKGEDDRLRTILKALQNEMNDLPPADSIEELESHLEIPKKRIEELISQVGKTRNVIQELETILQQHQHSLHSIQECKASKNDDNIDVDEHELRACPNCGYVFDDEILSLVWKNYSILNENFFCQQIQLIIDSIVKKLDSAKEQYVSLMQQLRQEETAYRSEKDEFDVYIRQRGLRDSVRRFSIELGKIKIETEEISAEIKEINREINRLPNKKEVEEKYIEFVRLNIMTLGAWDHIYDGNIRLLKPIKAQGSLENKIILAQFVGLFQTMDYFKSSATRFPFVVDSPRAKETSFASSKDILNMIAQLDVLPQIILATIDYDNFKTEMGTPSVVITLTDQKSLLCEREYYENETIIKSFEGLLKKA